MEQVRFAVVGIGRMGGTHAYQLLRGRVKGACLAAVCDISDEALLKFACRHKATGIPAFKSYKEMLDGAGFDAVIIAVPHYFHIEIARFFIENGKYVLIEKPIGVTVGEAYAFNDFLKDYEGKAAVMYNQRTNPVYRKAKTILDKKALGKIVRASFIITDWYRSDAYYESNAWRASFAGEGGGVLINQCVHQLDVLQWLIGLPESIEAHIFTKGRRITAENEVTALLKYTDDVYCTLSASGRELWGANRIEIAGDRGRLVIGKNVMKHISWKYSEPEVNASTTQGYGYAPKRVRYYFYGLRLIPDLISGQQIRIVKNFTAHIKKGEKLISPAEEGVNALSIINGIYLSAWENKAVKLPLDGAIYEKALKEKIREESEIKNDVRKNTD
ncbi:MAG: Gfo/Idh/MocA family oxidoreductase [Clostridiales bacterium]|jgi:predicted dehydrogenase|nr:Gfo/Idh/MocA family oxidoreductase [Clostridiales bacterium]